MINNIKLRNLKAFGEFDQSVTALNLITGLNGMGKSTLIQSLLLLRQSHQIQKELTKGLFLNGEYVKLGKGIDAYWIHGPKDEIGIEITWDGDVTLNNLFKYISTDDVLPHLDFKVAGDAFHQSLFTQHFQYLNAERIGQKDIYPSSEYVVSELNSLGNNGEYTTYFLEKKSDKPLAIAELLHEMDKTNTLAAQVDAWLGEISPGVSFIPQSITDSEISRQFFSFEFGGESTRRFRSSNVGFGLNYVLPVLTAVLNASPGDLLLIENPEAHIHPRGQSRLGWLFAIAASKGVQLFIETHSDHVLNGIRVAVKKLKLDPDLISLFYFDRDIKSKAHETMIHRPKLNAEGKVDKWPDGFLDEWDNMLDELI